MDFLNKAKEQFSQNSANQGQQGGMDPNQQGQNTGAFGGGNNPNQQQGMNAGAFGGGNNNNIAGGANNSGQEDYGDKGLDFIEKKTGHVMNRDTNEKITDGARGLFEKATGKQVDSKWSN